MSMTLSNFARLFAIFLVIITMTLGHSSAALAESKKRVTVNQVMHTAFLLRKSRMISSLQRRLQNIPHKGSFFPGEIAEIKGIASDLKKVKFQVKELPQGFLLIAERDQFRASVGIEFVDPLMGIIRVGGHTIQLKKGMGYLELAKTIAPVILPAFLKESKLKKLVLTTILCIGLFPMPGERKGKYWGMSAPTIFQRPTRSCLTGL